jgi:hypothetical protein
MRNAAKRKAGISFSIDYNKQSKLGGGQIPCYLKTHTWAHLDALLIKMILANHII